MVFLLEGGVKQSNDLFSGILLQCGLYYNNSSKGTPDANYERRYEECPILKNNMGTMATGRNDSFVTVVALKGVLMVVIAETTVEKSEVRKQCRTNILVYSSRR